MSFEEVAEHLGISKHRAQQIYISAIKKLKTKINPQTLRDIIEISDKSIK